ncbi:MAG: tetratricopeptide repeat protein [Magnetococcales bacterium]|nr:tetratricopeptide repeat protein [Magnetococcales bacterium]
MNGAAGGVLGARISEVAALARQGLGHEPDNSALLNVAAICAAQLGDSGQAEALWRQALVCDPAFADLHNNLGVLLDEQRRFDEAESFFREALRLRPEYAEAYLNLGNVLRARKRLVEAEEAYRSALRLRPDFVEAYNNLGTLLHGRDRLTEAEAAFHEALRLRPESVEACNNYGNLLDKQNRYEEAEAFFWQALRLNPEQVVGYLNLGNLFDRQSRHQEAMTVYLEALRRRPLDADALFFLSLTLLALGRYAEGWPLYENRYNVGKKEPILLLPELPFPQWQGEDLTGKSLLVLHEQGYGDEMQFSRFLPVLKELGVSCITLVCKKPLKALLAYGLGIDRILAHDEVDMKAVPSHDAWTLLLSIPLHLRITLDNIPATLPYLHPPVERISLWATAIPDKGCRVGLVWKGNPGHLNDLQRSLSGLAVLAPLWSVAGVTFVSLQTGSAAGEAAEHPTGQPLVDLGSMVQDFADTAAIVAQLDLVIGVDTAVIHLAGALGKPCWVMLPGIGTDWRWLEKRCDSPWYPDVMRLFWQEGGRDWSPVVEQIKGALQEFVTARAEDLHPGSPDHS